MINTMTDWNTRVSILIFMNQRTGKDDSEPEPGLAEEHHNKLSENRYTDFQKAYLHRFFHL